MADELNDAGVESTDGQEAVSNVLTKEEVDRLIEERVLSERKEWQSRFDKIRAEKEEIKKEMDDSEKSWQQKMQEQVQGVREELETWKSQATVAELRGEVARRVSSAGLELDDADWEKVNKLIDPKAEDPLGNVDWFIAREKKNVERARVEGSANFAKNHGRKVEDGKPSFKTLNDYTADEIKKMPADEFDKIMARSKQE